MKNKWKVKKWKSWVVCLQWKRCEMKKKDGEPNAFNFHYKMRKINSNNEIRNDIFVAVSTTRNYGIKIILLFSYYSKSYFVTIYVKTAKKKLCVLSECPLWFFFTLTFFGWKQRKNIFKKLIQLFIT